MIIFNTLLEKSREMFFYSFALFLCLLTGVILLFVLVTIPMQRNAIIKGLESQAKSMSASLAQVNENAIVHEDYSFIVEHNNQVLERSRDIVFIKIIKKDGFSIIHTIDGWKRSKAGDAAVIDENERPENGSIRFSHIVNHDVYKYVFPLYYSGFYWGNIEVALSLDNYHAEVKRMYKAMVGISFFCLLTGAVGSLVFARELTNPIKILREQADRISKGDFTVRTNISSRREIEDLASTFNIMAEQLQQNTVDIKKYKDAQEEITKSLEEKNVLLKEIHHRVKNNLSITSSLLYLQSKNIKEREYYLMFKDMENRIKSMSLVHESLYQSLDFSKINFQSYSEKLVKHLFASYSTGNVRSKVQVESVSFNIDKAVPFALIINELVSNALKYAFPDNKEGEIIIYIANITNDLLLLKVSDNGVGIPDDFDMRQTGSLGLNLVNTLVKQLHGELSLNRQEGLTEFQISFPEKLKR